MNINNPSRNIDEVLPAAGDESIAAVRARIAQFCAWFDVPVVKVKNSRHGPTLTNELADWFKESGASWDWVLRGGVKAMALCYRDDHLKTLQFVEAAVKFDETERLMLNETLRVIVEKRLQIAPAMETLVAAVREKRAAVAA